MEKIAHRVSDLAEITFAADDRDPEVLWDFFRKELRKIKAEHTERYLQYMEEDCNEDYTSTFPQCVIGE